MSRWDTTFNQKGQQSLNRECIEYAIKFCLNPEPYKMRHHISDLQEFAVQSSGGFTSTKQSPVASVPQAVCHDLLRSIEQQRHSLSSAVQADVLGLDEAALMQVRATYKFANTAQAAVA